MSKYSKTGSEDISIASRVAKEEQHVGRQNHILRLMNSFQESGPNGEHLCLVYKPMAVTAVSGRDVLPPYRDVQKRYGEVRRYPKWMVKRILRHTLLGLTQLHALDIVHGDLQQGNLLFASRDLNGLPEEELVQDVENTTEGITRLDDKEDKWAPRYLAAGQNLSEYAEFGESFKIEISDLGGGKWSLALPFTG